jgi:MFS superfamily sulfate permease-like transporter
VHGLILPSHQTTTIQVYVKASSISQKYADAFGYKVDVNQDLFGLASWNLLSLSFGGVLVSGAFGRSALTAEVGGHTPLVNFYLGM